MRVVRLAYGPGEHRFGDLRLPDGPGPYPVLVLIHGGFWRSTRALDLMDPMAEDLTERGYATWNIEYRRVGHEGGGWPGTLTDVALAADFLRQLAPARNLDLNRVVAVGHSAGGHLALWLAGRHRLPPASPLVTTGVVPLSLTGVVSLAGVNDLALMWAVRQEESPVAAFLGGTPAEMAERYAQASPRELLPLGVRQALVHGTADDRVPFALSSTYCQAACAAGDEAELVALPGADHFQVIDPNAAVWAPIVAAIQRVAGHP